MKTLIIALLISSVVSGQQSWKANKITITELPIDWRCNCHPSPVGQLSDFRGGPAKYEIKDTVPFIGFGVQIGEIVFGQPKPLPKDTIPSMLLITDTSIAKPVYQVFAIKGYRVLENGYGYNDNMTTFSMKYLISYLDENKKPLPNTWVVWQTIFR